MDIQLYCTIDCSWSGSQGNILQLSVQTYQTVTRAVSFASVLTVHFHPMFNITEN